MSEAITQEQVRKFVEAWYQALDFHVPVADAAAFVADEGLEMIWPEKTFQGIDNFKAWYAGGTYSDGERAPGVINLFFDENHNVVSVDATIQGDSAEVRVILAWQTSWWEPPAAKSKRTSVSPTQTWTVRRSSKNSYGLEITYYNAIAEPFAYAPGFARL